MNWKDTVKDQDEIKVVMALDGPAYTWRTASGVARQAGLREQHVWEILKKYNMEFTRISELLSASGSALVGLLAKVG